MENKIFCFLVWSVMALLIVSCKPNLVNLPPRVKFDNNLKFPDTTYQLVLTYFGMTCDCPQWITEKNLEYYESAVANGNSIPMDSLFVNVKKGQGCNINPFEIHNQNLENEIENTFLFEGRMSMGNFKWQGDDGEIWNNKVFEYQNVELVNPLD